MGARRRVTLASTGRPGMELGICVCVCGARSHSLRSFKPPPPPHIHKFVGANAYQDASKKGKCVVLKTSTRQTVFLPVAGLVDPATLKPGDLVGVNKDSYLILDTLPAEYDSRVKAMEVDEKPSEDYTDIGGLDKQVGESEGERECACVRVCVCVCVFEAAPPVPRLQAPPPWCLHCPEWM